MHPAIDHYNEEWQVNRFGIFALNMAFWRFFLYSVALWRSRTEKKLQA